MLSKDPQARVNELLAKLLAYNIGVLVHGIFEHRIDPGIPGLSLGRPRGPGSPEAAGNEKAPTLILPVEEPGSPLPAPSNAP